MSSKGITIILALFLAISSCTTVKVVTKSTDIPKNIIFMIVDGMGFKHVQAARIYRGQKPFSFENFTCKTKVSTCSVDGADREGRCLANSPDVTDSAAAATAIATGIKVKNRALSLSEKGSLKTIAEVLKERGKSTGVIATVLFSDATPAAFLSHVSDRKLTDEILKDIFSASQPNVVFGADTPKHRTAAKSSPISYMMVHTKTELVNLAQKIASGEKCSGSNCPHVYGGFGLHDAIPGIYPKKFGLPMEFAKASEFSKLQVPHLSEMTSAALKILSKNPDGFFLMVESSLPDMISHYHTHIDVLKNAPKAVEVLIHEMLEVENTIAILESFVKTNPDTLVILTADHETGGLVIDTDKTNCLGQEKCIPTVRWTAAIDDKYREKPAHHTSADVPLYATGRGATRFCRERINNTDIPRLAVSR